MELFKEPEDEIDQQKADAQPGASKIPLMEERLNIGIREVGTGSVQLHKKVIAEAVTQEVPVTREEVQVERKTINVYVDAVPSIRYEGDTTIFPVVKEVLVVEKRLMLVEEIHLTKTQITSNTLITETLRKEEIEINRTNTENITNKNQTIN